MQRIVWSDSAGEVSWERVEESWLGRWERRCERTGHYASAQRSMVGAVLAGEMEVRLGPGGPGAVLRAGDALVIHAGTPFSYCMASGTRLTMTDIAQPNSAATDLGVVHIPHATLPRPEARALADGARAIGALMRLARDGTWHARGELVPLAMSHSTRPILRVKRHFDLHFREPLRVRDVATAFRLDPFYLTRHFRRVVGLSPKPYLQWLRFEYFLRSLLATPRPILELALDAGFPDYATFCRRLRLMFGVPPSQLLHAS
jgi:AraC-like DNA-binding protein